MACTAEDGGRPWSQGHDRELRVLGQRAGVADKELDALLRQALHMVTMDAAYVLGINDKAGSLEPAKLADFSVLERESHDVRPAAIRDISVWATVLGGRVVQASEIGAR